MVAGQPPSLLGLDGQPQARVVNVERRRGGRARTPGGQVVGQPDSRIQGRPVEVILEDEPEPVRPRRWRHRLIIASAKGGGSASPAYQPFAVEDDNRLALQP